MTNIITKNGGIYFENIIEGFDNFAFETIKLKGSQAFDFINHIFTENGYDNSFCDFYYKKLDNTSRKKVEEQLNENEIEYINNIEAIEDVFYTLDEKLMKIIIKLNETETLFSTFYFTKNPATLWGNYNNEYVIFTN